jgi:death-on-curing protein
MKRFSKEHIIKLHSQIVELTGGTDGVREMGLLESAIESPFQACFGADVYPTIQEKGTRLGFGLIKNHCMLDGNKRIGVHAMLVFFDLNGIVLSYTQKELYEMVLAVAGSTMEYEDMLEWVSAHQVL